MTVESQELCAPSRVIAVAAILALLALAGCSQPPTPAPTDTPLPEPTYAGPNPPTDPRSLSPTSEAPMPRPTSPIKEAPTEYPGQYQAAPHETVFLRSLPAQDLACLPSEILTDSQFWEYMRYVSVYNAPGDNPPEFNCMSDRGKLSTYVMGYFERYEVWPEHSSGLSSASRHCMVEALGRVELPWRDLDDTVLFGASIISVHCLTDEELKAMDLSEHEVDYMRCSIKEWGGPLAMMAAMTGEASDGVKEKAGRVEEVCSDYGESGGQTPTKKTVEESGPSSPVSATTPTPAATPAPAHAPTPIPAATPCPEPSMEGVPEDVDPAWVQDSRMYAEQFCIGLAEAIRRLTLQESIGKLGAALEANEAATLGGLWIQHEPEFRVVVAFTVGQEDGREHGQ